MENNEKNNNGRIIVIDNYDSFTYNLVQYLGEIGEDPLVFRNDEIDLSALKKLQPRALIISPGPGTPEKKRYFGVSIDILRNLSPEIPTLGVCLGHQGIAVAFGGKIKRAEKLYHGKTTPINHDGKGLFKEIPNPFKAARYHSLIINDQKLPSVIQVTARSPSGEIMALKHKNLPIYGVQFHPESILTPYGRQILVNFLKN